MKFPTSIIVAPYKITIEQQDNLAEDESCVGKYQGLEKKLVIEKKQLEYDKAVSLWHEFCHCVLDIRGQSLWESEAAVLAMENLFHELFNPANKDMLKYFIATATKKYNEISD